jgi:16S rRNA processing protein RimM
VLSAEVPDDEVPDDPEEFFDHQLRGLAVLDTDGRAIGVVDDVLHLPGQDLLAVRREGGREVLVPFVAELVPQIDLEAGRVVIDPPPGLLNLDELDPAAEADGDRPGE